MIAEKTLKTLEFDKILNKLCKFSVNEDTMEFIMSLTPESNYNKVLNLLNETCEADKILNVYFVNPIASFDKIETVLNKAPKFSILTLSEILKTGRFLRASRVFKNSIEQLDKSLIIFHEYCGKIYIDNNLEKEIERAILSDETIADNASSKLSSIRNKIKNCNESIKEKLASIMHSSAMQKYLQDSIITIRQGRYVLPVKSEFRSSVAGLIHDQSSSGATVFIEPMAVVEANNELKILYIEEQQEIERILAEFTQKISLICPLLKSNLAILITADAAFSKAKYAKAINAVCPVLNSHLEINIIEGRHPLIAPEKVVPVSIKIGKNYKILVITGPNTGGKTVTLKLCGLTCLMAMCGMFIPCGAGSSVSVFNNIFCDIGDEQSIEQNLSTFSSHIKNISNIVNAITDKTLVLFDELGAGTDPKEGAALALSIVDYLATNQVTALITTHYSELKEYSFVKEGIENASMDFNPETFAPTYKLKIGIPGSSNAIEIAKRLELKQEIIDNARSHMSSDKIAFENIIKLAEKSRFAAEKIQSELAAEKIEYDKTLDEIKKERDSLKTARENLLRNSKFEAKRIISDAKQEADEIIVELKNLLNSDISDYTLQQARQLKNKLDVGFEDTAEEEIFEKLKPVDLAKLKIDDTVFIKSLNSTAKIKEIIPHKNEALITIGSISTRVKFTDIFLVNAERFKQDKKNQVRQDTSAPEISIKTAQTEINLLGQNTLEAVSNAEAFLDNAIMQGLLEVKIIHGIGTGALKNAITQMLKTHKGVKEFRPGTFGEGERGVTVIKLK